MQLFPGRHQDQGSRQSSRRREHGTLTVWAAAIKSHPADATVLVVRHPEPSGHAIPTLNLHLHGGGACEQTKETTWLCQSAQLQHLGPQGSRGGRNGRPGRETQRAEPKFVCKVVGAGWGPSWKDQAPQEQGPLHFQSICRGRTVGPASTKGLNNICKTVPDGAFQRHATNLGLKDEGPDPAN